MPEPLPRRPALSAASARTLVIARAVVAAPMGAQVYEREILARSDDALAGRDETWTVRDLAVRSLRSDLPGTARAPIGLLERGGAGVRRAMGRLLYPRDAVVHRMGLTLPPSPGGIVTLHDVVAWRFPDEGRPVPAAAGELRDSFAVVTPSAASAADAAELFGLENLHVIPQGVDDRFRGPAPLTADRRAALGIAGRYVLHAGGASRRKNLPALADAWRRVSASFPDVVLALAGPEHPHRTELFRGLDRVVLLGRVPDADVPGLVQGAEAVLVPSLHEGFGLPVLEAMAAGAPVIAAETSSLPEVAGGAALLVAPTGEDLAEGLADLLAGRVDRADLVARGRARAAEFTWERTAREHAEVWRAAG